MGSINAVQIGSRPICRSIAALLQLELIRASPEDNQGKLIQYRQTTTIFLSDNTDRLYQKN
ncbi:hypothetical protein CH54_58 [Yersinia rochesterensis]|nr:hypothetical protein DJ57_913 [Yersinia rochesterensis]AJI88039.1 hypothetical protein AW19_1606 [Yersinia frederiksenii Y225]AJJ35605.1 hypothetical protein CH54_58 [Yersinia rochesterensis]CNG77984.1 Uncharacterised protein [Yersinia kristensenii]CRY60737.1 Uncharacterised protein [Yersinia kristensenii]